MLSKGENISHYKIISAIGAGGMGEVYLAEDMRLDRKVAIKVLPSELSSDEDRLRRFEQEAKATSALNHPNILTVYDIGEHDGSPFIVSELLEGGELRDRLDEGAIPLRKVTEYAQQIVSGLSAAHEKGIVHRDLKPENLFMTKDERVKILDFGLAKLREPSTNIHGSEDATRRAMTDPGVVMGTVGYMSPEQVRGQMTDHRSDIFSFGLILYEMVTGRRAFQEESLAETMSAIVKEEPPEMTESNPNISPSLERIVRRCLEKKPDRRFQSTADLGFALESLSAPTSSSGSNTTAGVSVVGSETGKSPWLNRIPWIVAAAAVLTALVVPAVIYVRRPIPDTRPVSFLMPLPESASAFGTPSISPDGRTIAFQMTVDGKKGIYVRDVGSLTEQRLNGTENGGSAFWSPDSRTIAFFADEKLKKVDVAGGSVQVLCNAPRGHSGAWSRDGVILFGARTGNGIRRVSAAGGEVTELLPLDDARKETTHLFPRFLPDGRHFFYRSHTLSADPPEIFIASIDGKERQPLFKNSSDFYYIEPGYLLFARDTTVMAEPFDASSLRFTGDPVAVVENVAFGATEGRSYFSVSDNGALVYKNAGGAQRQFTWFDRQGKEISKVGPPGEYSQVALSPDGNRAAVTLRTKGNSDIWLVDLERGLPTRFTFNAAKERYPVWSSDGSYILFQLDNDDGRRKFYRKLANGAGDEELISDEAGAANVGSGAGWSPDGKNTLFASQGEKTGDDIWVLPITGDAKPYPLLQSEFKERDGCFSPDGRFFAYVSNESSREEVYIQTFPIGGGKWQVSTGGGGQPQWQGDGKELYYIAPDRKLMAVSVKLGEKFEYGAAIPLFQTEVEQYLLSRRYAAARDGQRFLINSPVEGTKESPFTVVLNWTSTLKK